MSSTPLLSTGSTPEEQELARQGQAIRSVYVYEAPVRIWHWVNVFCIVTLCVTGYFIGSPLPTLPGEPSDHFLMGYIRFAHFTSGYVMAIALLGRIYWGFVGNHHAREMFSIPLHRKEYWTELLGMIKWYAFLSKRPGRYVGHNPLARAGMLLGFFVCGLFMICTGFALYGEGAGHGSWANTLFSSWVIPLFGQSQDVHTWHHFGMWAMIIFIIVHIYAAVREDIMGRQSIISTMVSGYRTFKD
ncbi:Ni/Fe-hydrogenase, b-type cytochrome subunit [Amphibiibacter pelophylacis]|uniref:Ni/Fe-hydrogenase, b-type cytochrome subunit n=1 Tax=Amphibiibacter pelophylacis TaxID=1799477 RepID=A0ACC6P057_9BURK